MTPRDLGNINTTGNGTKTIAVFLPAEGEASWLLTPSLVSLLSGCTVQPENIYSCILKVTGKSGICVMLG